MTLFIIKSIVACQTTTSIVMFLKKIAVTLVVVDSYS